MKYVPIGRAIMAKVKVKRVTMTFLYRISSARESSDELESH